jgi:hypothetical protein
MKMIFTRSSLPLSKLIRWGLKEPVSHFAMVFFNSFVVHSNLAGVQLNWYSTFKKHCEVIYEIERTLSRAEEINLLKSILNSFDGASYDYSAFFYFIWRAILWRLFKTPFPATNKWGKKNAFLCTGLEKVLPESITPGTDSLDPEMTSPYKLYQKLNSVQ